MQFGYRTFFYIIFNERKMLNNNILVARCHNNKSFTHRQKGFPLAAKKIEFMGKQ